MQTHSYTATAEMTDEENRILSQWLKAKVELATAKRTFAGDAMHYDDGSETFAKRHLDAQAAEVASLEKQFRAVGEQAS